MSQTSTGWMIFVAALGMMLGMVAIDIASLKTWSEATSTTFVGTVMGHIAAVTASFIGGKLIPEERSGKFTRAEDPVHDNPPKV